MTPNWLQDADYTIGSPTTTLGTANLSLTEFTSRLQSTTDAVLAAVGGVTRPDGVQVVDTIFFVGEANLPDSQTPPGSISHGLSRRRPSPVSSVCVYCGRHIGATEIRYEAAHGEPVCSSGCLHDEAGIEGRR